MSVQPIPVTSAANGIIRSGRQCIIAPLFEPTSVLGRALDWATAVFLERIKGRKVTVTSFEHLRIVFALDPHNYLQDDLLTHRDAHLTIFTFHARSITPTLAAHAGNNTKSELELQSLQDALCRFALHSSITILCGHSVRSAVPLEQDENFLDALSDVHATISASARRSSGCSWSSAVYDLLLWRDKAQKPLDVLDHQLDRLIQEKFCEKGMKGKQTFHVLIHLLRFLVATPHVMDQLRHEVLDNPGVCDAVGVASLRFIRATIDGKEFGQYPRVAGADLHPSETVRLIPPT
ncbi:hypothetical protein C0992_011410 [Termitomyces sp. T32_za158]|nr:hypothetical protein C0992_011410 [Termitomyces sp. T32_za158]